MERLDKLVCSQSTLSRREVCRLIRAGKVTVDGAVCAVPDTKVAPERAVIAVEGKPLRYRKYLYLMLNKPAGILCVSRDPKAKTVVDLVPSELKRGGLFPAGRLDKDTTGLVLLTDDGDLAHRVLSPKNEIFKQYLVMVDAPLGTREIEAFAAGVTLEDGTLCRPAVMQIVEESGACRALVEICEGRFHQIKRMFKAVGRTVVALERRRIGGLWLDPSLASGECRELTEEEERQIFE